MSERPRSRRPRKPPAARRRAAKSPALNDDARAVGRPDLERKRAELAARFTELQWDLGGMAYEMASREMFVWELLVRQAAELQTVDAELAQVERLLRMEYEGATGSCSACGALHARAAAFCWQCGAPLAAPAAPTAAADRQVPAVAAAAASPAVAPPPVAAPVPAAGVPAAEPAATPRPKRSRPKLTKPKR